MAFEHRLVPPSDGALRGAAMPSSDEERIVALLDAHRTQVEALRCELALATRFLEAIAAHDLVRVEAIESESERAPPRATCRPSDFGCFGTTKGSEAADEGEDPPPSGEDESDFPEVREAEAGLRAALAGTLAGGPRRGG